MGIPYTFIKVMKGEEPYLGAVEKMGSKRAIKSFMKPGKMRGKYLGACLDACRFGTQTACVWETNITGLMEIIQYWREENNDNPALYHELPIGTLYTKFELPHINHEKCPRNEEHKKRFTDIGGRIRCGHISNNQLKLSFTYKYSYYDELAQMKVVDFIEEEPENHFSDIGDRLSDSEGYEKYLRNKKRFDSEKPEEVRDVCYAIISDKGTVLSFENILRRLNVLAEHEIVYCKDDFNCSRIEDESRFSRNCFGHLEETNMVAFPFDGWDLAYYLQRWKEQADGKAPWFAKKREIWTPKPFIFEYD